MKHGQPPKPTPAGDRPLSEKPAGPAGTGPQESPRDLLPPDLPPGAVHYESTDVKTRPVAKALVILVAATIAVVVLLYPLFLWFRGSMQRADPAPPPMGRHEAGRLPVEPRLQTTPVLDMGALRKEDERLLSSYGWTDEQRGVARIPIEVAMRLIAERGLPAPAANPSPAPSGSPAAPASAAARPAPGAQR